MEIERKYRLVRFPDGLENFAKKEIEQGYISRNPVLRIRKSNDDLIFTFKDKNKHSADSAVAICNEEVECFISRESYEHLKTKVDGHLIQKTRYIIPLDGGLKAELDVFHGRLEGLAFVEVEFPDVASAESFEAPDWFGEDVSMDKRYRNGRLSTLESLDEF